MKSETEPLIVYGTLQKVLFVLCGGGWGISMGIEVGIGVLLNEIREEWELSYLELGLVTVFTMIGVFIGSHFWGILADKIGRKPTFDKLLFPMVLGLVLSIFSPNIWMLASCYIIIGFSIGGSFTVDGNVFLEYCPAHKQYLLTTISVLSALGCCLPVSFALMLESVPIFYQWRVMNLCLALVALGLAIPRFWIQETPFYLMSKHRTTEAVKLLQKLNSSVDEISLHQQVLLASPKEKNEEKPVKMQFLALFRKPVLRFTLLYLVIWPLNSFTFIGVTSFLPIILMRAGYHQSDQDLYETMLYQQIGNRKTAGIPGVMLGSYMVRTRVGRKGTLVFSQFFAVIFFLGFLIENYWALVFLSCGYFFFVNMFFAVVFCITPETFPVEVRNTAIGLLSSGNTVAAIISPIVAGVVLEYTGGNFVFVLIYSGSIFIVAFFCLFTKETSNFNPASLGPLTYK